MESESCRGSLGRGLCGEERRKLSPICCMHVKCFLIVVLGCVVDWNVVWCYKLGLSIRNYGDSALQLGFAFAVPVPPSLLVVPVVDNTLTRF